MLSCLVVDNFSDCSFYQHIALVLSIAEAADASVMCIHGNDYLIVKIEHGRVLGNNLCIISKRRITILGVGEPADTNAVKGRSTCCSTKLMSFSLVARWAKRLETSPSMSESRSMLRRRDFLIPNPKDATFTMLDNTRAQGTSSDPR